MLRRRLVWAFGPVLLPRPVVLSFCLSVSCSLILSLSSLLSSLPLFSSLVFPSCFGRNGDIFIPQTYHVTHVSFYFLLNTFRTIHYCCYNPSCNSFFYFVWYRFLFLYLSRLRNILLRWFNQWIIFSSSPPTILTTFYTCSLSCTNQQYLITGIFRLILSQPPPSNSPPSNYLPRRGVELTEGEGMSTSF